MKVNITGFMRNMLRPRCGEMVAEFLDHLKQLRNDPSKHKEFFDLYVFGDDTQWRASSEVAAHSTSDNTSSPKFPTWEEVYKWAIESHGSPDIDQGKYAILRGCYEFICRKLRA